MDFDDRLKKAVERGKRRGDKASEAKQAKELSEQEVRQRHSQYRLTLSEHIERCLKRLPNHFPGFQYETIFGDRGWGGACYRDDLSTDSRGKRTNYYTRLEMTIRPRSAYPVLDLTAKGTIRNKEMFARSHFDDLESLDADTFIELIDLWVIEFAELYAASG